jgi:hypothetical protein
MFCYTDDLPLKRLAHVPYYHVLLYR